MLVSPFDLFIDGSKLTLDGISKLDGSIAYQGLLSIPSSYVKNEVGVINNLTSGTKFSNLQLQPNDFLYIAVNVGGTFTKPEVKLNLMKIKSSLKQSVKNAVSDEVAKKKEEAKARATDEANKIKDEAQKKAEEAKAKLQAEIDQKKKEAAERLRKEAEEQKKKLKDEAKNKLKGLFDK
ncbi:cell envelope integrity protein TolA [Bacteroidia bacterium]|nr:cell envelope integrity protein TolA [Bacteroidia bacterium]